jgi:predicted SAM-dependent methyltransferase
MKLNLGCGSDIREGYLNIDINQSNNKVIKLDIRNIPDNICPNDSCDEILAINLVEYLKLSDLVIVMKCWYDKLIKNGIVYVESTEARLIGNMLSFEQISLEHVNGILYPDVIPSTKSIYNLSGLETFMKSIGFNTLSKGYRGNSFYLRMTKS